MQPPPPGTDHFGKGPPGPGEKLCGWGPGVGALLGCERQPFPASPQGISSGSGSKPLSFRL